MVRRSLAEPVRKLILQPFHRLLATCDVTIDRFCYEGDSPPAVDPPPGFVERGSDWAEYPEGKP
jgi:hypothetical protein